jgi:putative ABC transport system ATP-binding protein
MLNSTKNSKNLSINKKNSKKVIIELKNLWKSYFVGDNRIDALKNINFKVYSGEFVVIIGKSGSGKTTLVNQIGCLDTPTQGEIILDGINIEKLSDNQIAKVRGKKIGYIFQKFNLIKTLTTFENVELPMIFQEVEKEQRRKKVLELLEEFEMINRKDNKPTELSGGQQQRVAIARALANDPEMILADEPTGNLDSKTGKKVIENLKELNKKGKTIILVTHDDNLTKIGDRIITIKDGEIISDEKN